VPGLLKYSEIQRPIRPAPEPEANDPARPPGGE
jgi:hypothetical protein